MANPAHRRDDSAPELPFPCFPRASVPQRMHASMPFPFPLAGGDRSRTHLTTELPRFTLGGMAKK